MTGYTPIYNLPYPQPSDLVSAYPGTGQDLAEEVETVLAAKLPIAGGKILQVQSGTYATATTTTSTTYVTTNLTASITPTSTSNKVLVIAANTLGNNTAGQSTLGRIFRGTVSGTAIGSETLVSNGNGTIASMQTLIALDSPSTTSAQTYTYGFRVGGGSTGTAQQSNTTAVMLLLEVSA